MYFPVIVYHIVTLIKLSPQNVCYEVFAATTIYIYALLVIRELAVYLYFRRYKFCDSLSQDVTTVCCIKLVKKKAKTAVCNVSHEAHVFPFFVMEVSLLLAATCYAIHNSEQ